MGRGPVLGSVLASLVLLAGCGVDATVLWSVDSGPSEEGGRSGLPDGSFGGDGGEEGAEMRAETGAEAGGGPMLDADLDGSVDGDAGGQGAEAGAGPVRDADLDGALEVVASDAPSGIAATMNDVSILFPLPSSAADVDSLLAATTIGSRGQLFPSGLYTSMGFIVGSTNVDMDAGLPLPPFGNTIFPPPYIAAHSNLRVVAMRIDPCFASLNPDPSGVGCTAQLRLIFQDVEWLPEGGPPSGPDSAIHASYDLSRAELLALARALVDLRVQNEDGDVLGPLAPHPIMVRQGLAGTMSQGVQRLILEYAGEQNLVRTAESSIVPCPCSAGIWGMSAFDVNGAPSTAVPRVIPTLVGPDGGTVVAQLVYSDDFGLSASPITESSDNYFDLYDPGPASSLPPSRLQAEFDALVRVENPRDNSPDTIDCAGCHLATHVEKTVVLPGFSLDDTTSPLAYAPDGTIVTRGDMRATFSDTDFLGPDIHAFSYESTLPGSAPTINQRVVNETAAVVEYLNAIPR